METEVLIERNVIIYIYIYINIYIYVCVCVRVGQAAQSV